MSGMVALATPDRRLRRNVIFIKLLICFFFYVLQLIIKFNTTLRLPSQRSCKKTPCSPELSQNTTYNYVLFIIHHIGGNSKYYVLVNKKKGIFQPFLFIIYSIQLF